jgi:hypothetical protein|nr:MAG TPA: hypothetical protein [Caudoviricetes sp.]
MIEQITIKAFIGSDNKTKKLEVDKIISIVNANYEAFTLDYPVIGYWRGEAEETAVLYLSDERQKVMNTLSELKEVLDQEAIAYQIENDLQLI